MQDMPTQVVTNSTVFPGYTIKLVIRYYPRANNYFGVFLCLVKGDNDDQLQWPVKFRAQLELLNQTGDHNHIVRIKTFHWERDEIDDYRIFDGSLIKYPDLEQRRGGDVQYMMNDCLKFRINIFVVL